MGKHMKAGLGLFAKPLGPIVASRYFQTEAADFPTVILIFDSQVGNGNLAIDHFQIESVRNRDSFVLWVLIGPYAGKGLVEVFLQLEVEDDAANLPAADGHPW